MVVVSTAALHEFGFGSPSRRFERNKNVFSHPRVKVSIVGSLRDREVACSASDRQGSNIESCVWRAVSSQSSHHTQEFILAQFTLYVPKARFISFDFYWDTECDIYYVHSLYTLLDLTSI